MVPVLVLVLHMVELLPVDRLTVEPHPVAHRTAVQAVEDMVE